MWTFEDAGVSRLVVHLKSFAHFATYIRTLALPDQLFLWRGHRRRSWLLESSLDRLCRDSGFAPSAAHTKAHLTRTLEHLEGVHARPDSENATWAVCQHHGANTPLLDWTYSPFIAAYFAFAKPNATEDRGKERRAVHGLLRYWALGASPGPKLELVEPSGDFTVRRLAQRGVFTRLPDGLTVDDWVAGRSRPDDEYVRLLTITFPDEERKPALVHLRQMNINHRTLFPDLAGATEAANMDFELAGVCAAFGPDVRLNDAPEQAPDSEGHAPPRVSALKSEFSFDRAVLSLGEVATAHTVIRDEDGNPMAGVKVETIVREPAPPNPFAM